VILVDLRIFVWFNCIIPWKPSGGTQMMAKASKASSPTTILTKKTAEKGGLQVKSLSAGTYLVTIKKVGFADQVVTINVNDGEMTVLNVSISKS
jgi:hypothetical protein